MVARLLLLVLLILNAGVGLWWWMKPSPVVVEPVLDQVVSGIPSLAVVEAPLAPPVAEGLAHEKGDQSDAADLKEIDPADASMVLAEPSVQEPAPARALSSVAICLRVSPVHDADKGNVRKRLSGKITDWRYVASPVQAREAWRVMIPPAADRQTALATAQRIEAAGLADLFVMTQGELAHAVALGQFRNQEGAKRRLDAVVAAGFPAVMQPVAVDALPGHAVVKLAAGVEAPNLAGILDSQTKIQSIDCSALR